MSSEIETLRWPTNLDRAAIVRRLVQIRKSARLSGLRELASRFASVERMSSVRIGKRVIAALTWLQDKPEHQSIAKQLAMVAMNLKNLK